MSNIKPIFFTSDWHLGHENALKFDERPFNGLSHMNEVLITRFNATVPTYGVCYFIGDMGNRTEDIRKVITRLNGIKVLILGNHDHGINTMYGCGFDVVLDKAVMSIAKQQVSISHCPKIGVYREDTKAMKNASENWHGESRDKHRRFAVPEYGQFHLHGHIHSRKDKPQSVKILGRQFDVGVTANNYTPVSISQIESWIIKTIQGEQT